MELNPASCTNRLTYVFDLDGVIYRGDDIQPHAREVLPALRSQGHSVRFFTNNSALSRDSYVKRLTSLGIQAVKDEIMTSSYAAALYFLEQNAAGKVVYQIGESGITEELEAVGMRVLTNTRKCDDPIDYVVVGIDRDFSYDKLFRAQQAILAGAKFIATNEDATYPMEAGIIVPGNGCLVAAVRAATSEEPFVIGKPQTYAFDKILDLAGSTPDRAVMVGDRLDTDILVGNRAGAHTVLVLTGVNTREDAENALGDLKPDRVIDTLAELLE